jgi:hypothetical protein
MANDASISGLTVGKGGGAVAGNTAVGVKTLQANTTGTFNTAVGGEVPATQGGALQSNTTGTYNTAMGVGALTSNTTSSYNSAFGANALPVNTGAYNTAVGSQALSANTTASENTAVGYQALYSNTTGQLNTAMGSTSMYACTTGSENTAYGEESLKSLTTANSNAAFGRLSLQANTTGANNTGLGYQALQANTTASDNTAVGYQAGYTNSTGVASVYLGQGAGYSTTSSYNTFVGRETGYSVSSGGYNTFLGQGAGNTITTGAKNTIIGRYDGNQGGLDIRTASNYIVLSDGDGNPRVVVNGSGNAFVGTTTGIWGERILGYQAGDAVVQGLYSFSSSYTSSVLRLQTETGAGTNWQLINGRRNGGADVFVVFGNGNVTNTNGSYGTISDAKLKENIVDATPKLDKVMQLQVRNFNMIGDDLKQIGFVAQELETVFPSLVESIEDKDEDDVLLGTVTKQVKTTVLIPILVKAIQELKAEVDSLKAQLNPTE